MTKYFLRRVDCMAAYSLPQRFGTLRCFCTFDAKKTKQTTPVSQKKSTALSAGGLEASAEESDGARYASAEESDGARYATRSLTRCTIKILFGGGEGAAKGT